MALLPQTNDSEHAVEALREMVASGRAEVRAYRRSPLHAKAYLCWYDEHAEPGAAVVGSSNLTLAGFSGNTELNVRVTGDAEMAALREWFDALWEDSEDIGEELQLRLDLSWALAETPPYHVYLKALYELYHGGTGAEELPLPPRDEELANFQLAAVRSGLAMIDVPRRLLHRRRRWPRQDLYRRRAAPPTPIQLSARRPTPHPLPGRTHPDVAVVQRAFWAGRGDRLAQHDRHGG